MKICLVSDIHMEFGADFKNATEKLGDGGDILIVAGDLTCSRFFVPLAPGADEHKRNMDKFVDQWTTKFKKTFYIMGNHEHYGYVLPDGSRILSEYLQGTNVQVMDPGAEIVDDVLFIGGTLWTDFNGGDLDTKVTIRYSMNDFRTIYRKHPDTLTDEEKKHSDSRFAQGLITPEYIMELNKRDYEFIDKALFDNINRKTVVFTHHAPTLACNGDGHGSGLIHGYCNRLDDFIEAYPQIVVWCNGHTHSNHDFYHGNTRLIANCRGYENYEDIELHFQPKFFEV
jgi:Icc-related predicted phosphoesterase